MSIYIFDPDLSRNAICLNKGFGTSDALLLIVQETQPILDRNSES